MVNYATWQEQESKQHIGQQYPQPNSDAMMLIVGHADSNAMALKAELRLLMTKKIAIASITFVND